MNALVEKIKNYLNRDILQKLKVSHFSHISIQEISRGGYNINFLVKIDNNKFVFRFNLDKDLDVDNQIAYEYKILKHVSKWSIAPKVFFMDTTKSTFDYDLLVEEFIDNKLIYFDAEFLKNFARLIRKLHSFSPPKVDYPIKDINPLINHWCSIKNKLSYTDIALDKNTFTLLGRYIPEIDRYVEKYAHYFNIRDVCLNHRDLVTENILLTDEGLILVDWQSAMIDDPSYDLAYFLNDIIIEWNREATLTEKQKELFLRSYQVDSALTDKIKIRHKMIGLELIVWFAFRSVYLQNKLISRRKEKNEQFTLDRINKYKSFLTQERIKNVLAAFQPIP